VNGVNRPLLLKNEKGGFRDVAEEVGLGAYGKLGLQGVEKSPFTYLCGWIDYDNDGDRDLVVGHRLLRNDEGSQFVDVTAESGLTFDSEPMGFYPIDYDCDGDLDIYVLYQGEYLDHDADGKPLPWVGDNATGGLNVLWQNQGDGSFVDVTEAANAGGGNRHSFAATWMFYNEDHFPDVYIANDFGENVMLLNKGDGTFEDITKSTGSGDFATSMGVASDDLDNDGQDEIYVANMFSKMGRRIIAHVGEDDYPEGVFEQIKGSCAGNRLYSRTGSDGTFKDLSEDFGINGVGWAYAPAMVDVDQDGLLDLYATTGFLSFERGKPDG